MTNQKAMQLIQAAQAGDEAAFQDIFEAFRGLVWTLYRDHSLQTQQYDWEQESRLVLYQTLRKLKATHWGALTRYYNQALRHRIVQLWRESYRYESVEGVSLNEACVTTYVQSAQIAPPSAAVATIVDLMSNLGVKEREFVLLLAMGYDINECAVQLERSRSWCYATRQNLKKIYQAEAKGS